MQRDPRQQCRVGQIEQRLVEECRVKPFNIRELWWPSLGVNPETPGSGRGCAERFLIRPVTPATDSLSERHTGNDRVAPPEERLPGAVTKYREGDGAYDERTVEGKSSEANIDCLGRMRDEVVSAQRDIIGPRSYDRE